MKKVEPDKDILELYRIISNGKEGDLARYKVQRRGWFGVWRDCRVAGHYMALYEPSVGIYESEEDAIAALEDLAQRETEKRLRNF